MYKEILKFSITKHKKSIVLSKRTEITWYNKNRKYYVELFSGKKLYSNYLIVAFLKTLKSYLQELFKPTPVKTKISIFTPITECTLIDNNNIRKMYCPQNSLFEFFHKKAAQNQ